MKAYVALAGELRTELVEHILPYWARHAVDEEGGGFVGRVDGEGAVVACAPKGSVLNARILWTFSAATRLVSEAYLPLARRAFEYFHERFLDRESGGVYWMLDHKGHPGDERKYIYAQAFAVYGLSEYFHATRDDLALRDAVELFRLIEDYGRDRANEGYFEAFSREWRLLEDARLSEKDVNEPKSMNTHLHVLEAYTNLYLAWPDDGLRSRLRATLEVLIDRVYDGSAHFGTFFGADWTPKSTVISYGHEIEGSWLMLQAADVLGDPGLRGRVGEAAVAVARAVLREGIDRDGAIVYEGGPTGVSDFDKHWWAQAEAIVGFAAAFEETGEPDFLDAALDAWRFIQAKVIDRRHGEWHLRLSRDGVPYANEDKIGPWKCPYHNARACLEIMRRAAHETSSTATHQPQ